MKTGIQIIDAMTRNPISIKSGQSLGEAASMMDEHHVGALLVKDNGNADGLITEQDIVRKAVAHGKNPLDTRVGECMETSLITITPEKDIYDALLIMSNKNIRHLPVTDEGSVIGLLTLKDVLSIEPALFDLLIDKFEIRERDAKPVHSLIKERALEEIEE